MLTPSQTVQTLRDIGFVTQPLRVTFNKGGAVRVTFGAAAR